MIKTKTNRKCTKAKCPGELMIVIEAKMAWVECDLCHATSKKVEVRSVR